MKYNDSELSKRGAIHCPTNCPDGDPYWDIYDDDLPSQSMVPGFIHVATSPYCIEAENDQSCTIPHFSHDDLVWSWCAKENGEGTFSINLNGQLLVCFIQVSTASPVPCFTKGKSCGIIICATEVGNNPLCYAGWNMPNKTEYYELPEGCISNSNPSNSDNNNLILPLSIAGAVAFTGIVSVVTTVAACLCYSSYKRRGYQSIQGPLTN